MLLGAEEDLEEKPALVPSLFPFVAPTLYFSTANEKGQDPPNHVTSAKAHLAAGFGSCRGLNVVSYRGGVPSSSPACCSAFVSCSGASAGGAKTAAEVEDEHRHAQRGQARHRQVSLQSHQE